jgi:uncharacterized protein
MPDCGTDLVMADRSGIEIDYCPQCRGVWLDRGELDKIIERSAAYETQMRPAPPDMGQMASQQRPPAQPAPPRYRDEDDDDYRRRTGYGYDYDDDRRYPPHKKKKGFLGDMFDIFD